MKIHTKFFVFIASFAVGAIGVPALAQVQINPNPSREFGQTLLATPVTSNAPNLIEGKELNGPSSIAFDYSVTPPAVYVADFGNNRILEWKSTSSLSAGNPADVVIGQNDFASNIAGGPGTNESTGLFLPVAVTVDAQGNLYVADSGNNRILRFPKGSASGAFPNLVIGQASFSSGKLANQGQSAPTSKTLFLSSNGSYFQTGMTFDSQGNLWVTDPGNNRALRYPAASLSAGTQQMAADTVLGQITFVNNTVLQAPGSTNAQIFKSSLVQPSSVAVDATGRLYIADGYARVLEFQPNPGTGQPADRVLGVASAIPQGGHLTYPTQATLGSANASGQITGAPGGVFTLGNNLFVCDTPSNRVVWYDVYGNWSPETTTSPSPQELGVLGQTSFTSGTANNGSFVPSGLGLSSPVAGAVNTATNELWIVDSGNNRVLVFPAQGSLSYTLPASRVLGQLDYPYNSPNLIEGKEVWFFENGTGAGAMVVDKNSNPPHLYVADFFNNRVLGFKDARAVGTDAHNILTQKADIVIGQPSLLTGLVNYSTNPSASGDPNQPGNTGLNQPVGLAVDPSGNLYVADSGNGRVLRFPAPFAQAANALQTANLVLGQLSFNGPLIKDPSPSTMNTPYGLALFYDSTLTKVTGLAVSDSVHNRILIFNTPSTGDFTNGLAASFVIGQTNFTSTQSGTSTSNLSTPRHIAADSSNRLYVADSANGRLLGFDASARTTNGKTAGLQVTGLSVPQGVAVSLLTGESWVTSTNSQVIYRFPVYETLQANQAPTAQISSSTPLAVALDQFDNLIVAEGLNRISFYFPQMYYRHAASYAAGINSSAVPTPGMLALLARYGSNFNLTATSSVQNLPWPTTLNDVQVIVNGVAAPIYFLESSVIHFQIPMSTPDFGTADFVVQSASTGQILAAGTFQMQQASPGIFTANQAGTQQIAANNYNPDGSYGGVNGPSNALTVKGGVITIWLTGQGKVNNPPPDGVAPGAAIPTNSLPTVYIGGVQAQILYSGLSPQYPGLWQIDAVVPAVTLPASNTSVVVMLDGYQSNIGGTAGSNGGPGADVTLTVPSGLITTMATK
jgi:uncharacterized protein (TIGR03437 family)